MPTFHEWWESAMGDDASAQMAGMDDLERLATVWDVATAAERERCVSIARARRPRNSVAWYYPWIEMDSLIAELSGEPVTSGNIPARPVDLVAAERERCVKLVEDFARRNPDVRGFGPLFTLLVGDTSDATETQTGPANGSTTQSLDTERPA